MNIEQLKAAMDDALEALKKDPQNAELKTKADEAKAAYEAAVESEGEGDDQSGESVDESKLDDKTKAYIAKLRKENAKHRTSKKDLKSKLTEAEEKKRAILKAAGIELDDEEDPAEKLKTVQAETQTLSFRNAILESAIQHGVPGDAVDYFSYLVTESVGKLEDGEELSEEMLSEIVAKVKKVSGGGKATTTVGKGGKSSGNAPAPEGKTGDVTLPKFVKMTISEKSDLYTKNRELYESLVKEAKEKKLLVS